MKRILTVTAALAAAIALSPSAHAQAGLTEPVPNTGAAVPLSAAEIDLDTFKWIKRPIVVFADTPADPRYIEQMRLLAERPDALEERDVVIITDTDPAARSSVRTRLRPRGFQLAIIGKDGSVSLRKPSPWDVREITRAIDKMPLRQDELHRQRTGS